MKNLKKKIFIAFTVAAIGMAVAFGQPLFALGYFTYLNLIETTRFSVEGTVVRMNGEINTKTYDQFIALHRENPQITTVYEETVPGSLDDETMIKLSYYIRAQGFNTMIGCHSEIDSGGVDLFLAGIERIVDCADKDITPWIGVHSWSDGIKQAADYPPDAQEHEHNRKYIEDMLGKDDFYWFTIYAAPADDIHPMTRAEIDKYGLVTKWR